MRIKKILFGLNFPLLMITLHFAFFSQVSADDPKPMGKVLGISTSEKKPDYFKESFLDFREDAEEASDAGKHMLVFAD